MVHAMEETHKLLHTGLSGLALSKHAGIACVKLSLELCTLGFACCSKLHLRVHKIVLWKEIREEEEEEI